MSTLKEQAVKVLQDILDEKMPFIVDMLKMVNIIPDFIELLRSNLFEEKSINSMEAIEAWKRFKAYKGIIPYEIDIKEELAQARDEKYADFI